MRYRVGDVLDGYELETECGSGAFGSVFLAKNRTLGQTCALKILYKNGRQYEKELEGLKTYQQKCRHANLMRVDHVGENDECIFYTMDAADNLHPGKKYIADTLGNRLKEKSRLSPDEIMPMLHDLLDGLNAMHSAGILHRDIKPDNILWVNGHAMLGDIGLISNNLEASMAGTPGFISPRVWSSHAFTPQDDLYALAMVMYCALNGAPPENYPIPGSMSLTDSVQQIIRVYNEVLKPDSAIKTVKDFQRLLTDCQNNHRQCHRKWILSSCGIALICAVLCIFIFSLSGRKHTVTIRNISETPVLPHRVEKTQMTNDPQENDTMQMTSNSNVYNGPSQKQEQQLSPAVQKMLRGKNTSTPDPFDRIAELQKVPTEKELLEREALWVKYDNLVTKFEKEHPIAETLQPYLRKMEDWYIKHQHDYRSTPEPEERTIREYNNGFEREPYRDRYAAYQKLSPCLQAVYTYAKWKFKVDILKQELLVIRHHDYVPSKMAKIYEEWCVAYRELERLGKNLLPVFDPVEFDRASAESK